MSERYRYQWRVLIIFFLGWGFAGLARNSIAFLFPYFSVDFGLTSAHTGYLAAVVACFWALSIMISGRLADRVGQRPVVTAGLLLGGGALLCFGHSPNVWCLYALAAVFGFGCGSVCAPSLSMIAQESNPKNRGTFIGIMQSGFTLIGYACGAVVITRLGDGLGWSATYTLVAVLVLATAVLVWLGLRPIPRRQAPKPAQGEKSYGYRDVLGYRNIQLSSAAACLVMMWYFTVAAFALIYLIEAKGFDAVTAGAIYAGFGLGGFFGEIGVAMVSDQLGRKKTVIGCALLGFVGYGAFLTMDLSPWLLTVCLFATSLFFSGLVPLVVSVIPSESVPEALVPTATAFTPAIGEMCGGVISPALAAVLSGIFGVSGVMHGLLAAPAVVLVIAVFLRETAPRALSRRAVTGGK